MRRDVAGIPEEWGRKTKLGLPRRDEQIASCCKSIENLGAVDVPVLLYVFSLRSSKGSCGIGLAEQAADYRNCSSPAAR